MARFRLRFLLLLVATIWSLPVAARSHTPVVVELTVSVFNDAGLSPDVLNTAKVRAGFIFWRAGFEVHWLSCGIPDRVAVDAGCARISYPSHLSLRLVSFGAAAGGETLGQSFLDDEGDGSYAYVYVRAVQSLMSGAYLREGELLGNVMAHELGHLLLGPHSHGVFGLMAARWASTDLQLASRGQLTFTPEESARLFARFLAAAARVTSAGNSTRASGT